MIKNHEPKPHFSLGGGGGEFGALNGKIGGSEEQAKFGFPVTAVIACRANFEKSYLTQF